MGQPFELNACGQPVGLAVDNWQGARVPERMVLEGRFCRLEPLEVACHAAELYQALQLDAQQSNWTYLDMPAERAAFIAWLEAMQTQRDPLFFVIVDGTSGKPVGLASYLRIDAANGVIEVGWLHYSPLLQRTPAATEAMYLMMRQAFAWGYRRYEWKCNALNAPSMRAAGRLGFTFEGIFRQARVDRGRNRDTAWFSVLDGEWPALQRAFEHWLAPDNFDAAGRQRAPLQVLIESERAR